MGDPVITVTPTVMDGQVVRWYRSETAAENACEVLSASRNGVMARGYLTEIPDEWIAAAKDVYETLRSNRDADARHLATHTKHWRDGVKKI